MFLCCDTQLGTEVIMSAERGVPSSELEQAEPKQEVPVEEVPVENPTGILSGKKEPFVLTLDLTSGAVLDVDLDTSDQGVLLVSSLEGGGAIEKWNSSCADSQSKVQELDRVVAVNGETGVAKELAAKLKPGFKYELTVKHAALLEISIAEVNKPIGLELIHAHNSKGLAITNVNATGHMKEWNDTAPADTKVMATCRVIRVNTKDAMAGEEPAALLKELKEAKALQMLVASWA
mmetsp:Transcript_30994/g.49778  ORF Transcript_30994/g.49778 Transcript_30994/m.49778 type:complete len:234 (+) Transcript_30994:65-766(+)